MSNSSISLRQLSIESVFRETFQTFRVKMRFFSYVTLIISVVAFLISQISNGELRQFPLASIHTNDGQYWKFAIGTNVDFRVLILAVLNMVVGAIGQIMTVRATAGSLGANAAVEFIPAIRAAMPKLAPLLVTSLLNAILVCLGLVLLVAPGLFLATMLLVSPMACILEGRSPVESLKRSRELTRGHRWQLLGLLLVLLVAQLGAGLVISVPSAAAGAIPGLGKPLTRIVTSVGEGLLTVVGGILLTHTFLELRRLKGEAAGTESAV